MNKTRPMIVIAALVLLASLTPAALLAAGQMDQQTRQGMGLTYESLEAVLKDLQAYDTSDVGPAMRLRAYIFSNKDNAQARKEAEAALLKFVQGSPAPAGLMAACRALSLIGGADSVPVLAALALKPETADPARYALERIPGPAADEALVAALDKSGGDVKRGIVFSLGARKTGAAVPALAKLAGGKDAALAADAIKALGKIGDAEAVKALTVALGKSAPALKTEVASALLLAAEGRLKGGDKASAAGIYDKVSAAGLPTVLRQAAFKGQIAVAADPKAMILKTLTGKDADLFAPALAMAPANFGAGEIVPVAELMDRLPESAKIQLTALLAGYPAETVRPYLLSAAEDASSDVRLAALRAITKAGDGKSVIFLATKAARTNGAEQDASRDALARLKGLDVDMAVLDHLAKASDEAVKAELVRAASERRVAAAKPELMALVKTGSAGLRPKAAAALRTLATQGDIPALLDLLGGLEDEAAREAMQDTVAAAARTNPRELARAGEARARLAGEKDAGKRADLLRVLGKIGDDSSLAQVRAALADPDAKIVDAAVRALAEWPTTSARDDVFEVARTSVVLNHRVLATRAYVRMIGLEAYRAPEGAAADLLRILALSPRPEEKKLVLAALVRFPCVTALKTAESLLADPEVAKEAKLASDRIRNALK
jgi:HEAT repeat protein